jgi:hypothetical protein
MIERILHSALIEKLKRTQQPMLQTSFSLPQTTVTALAPLGESDL